MITLFEHKNDCCGCTACYSVCPVQAIKMTPDAEGFLYPMLNMKLCVECGLCLEICAFKRNKNSNTSKLPHVYAAKHIDDSIRISSSSGGIFTAISDHILKNEGVVYGAILDRNLQVVHDSANSAIERDRMKGSKYVQSDLGDIFAEIKEVLEKQKPVLFTGTPCQVDGLSEFIADNNREYLYLCDVVCHGVPSPVMWNEHLKRLQSLTKSKVKEYNFRNKIYGISQSELAIFENGRKEYKSFVSQEHRAIFYSDMATRPACHQCKYANIYRVSDITIADFWGIEKSIPAFYDQRGVSLVLVNSLKGEVLFNDIKESINSVESNTVDCLQPQLQHPVEISDRRADFWIDYYRKGYIYVVNKYAGGKWSVRLSKIIKKSGKKFIRELLVKLRLLEIVKSIVNRVF